MTDGLTDLVEHCLDAADRQVAVGPQVWQPAAPGESFDGRRWYFTVATCGPDGFRSARFDGAGREATREARAALVSALSAHPPCVVVDFDCEVAMARWVAATWPSKRTADLRQRVELEAAPPGGTA